MKIIISHDVDHLYTTEHIFRDLIFPKLIIRSFIHFFKGKINTRTLIARCLFVFSKRMNRIREVIELDSKYGIPSTFFFGMNQGLGMSYYAAEATEIIKEVQQAGFDVGVHGIDFKDEKIMQSEYGKFSAISKESDFGIRMHYVRYDYNTFSKLSKIGYAYDTSEFNKEQPEAKEPYKIGGMWEFPLCIMDGYIIPTEDLETGIKNTISAIKMAEKSGVSYCTILYHDFQYNEKVYPVEKEWYDWLLMYLKHEKYEFISYKGAIEELEQNRV